MNFTYLKITSNNLDWAGEWDKAGIEDEMKEMENPPTRDNEWIEWVLAHVFMFSDGMTQELIDVISYEDSVTSITLNFADGRVTVKKS